MKKLAVFMCFLLIVSAIPVNKVTAMTNVSNQMIGGDEARPYYIYTDSLTLSITYSGSTVQTSLFIRGKTTVNKINGTLNLYKKNGTSYNLVKQWSVSSSGNTLNTTKSYSGAKKGETYKAVFSGTVSTSSSKESISKSYVKVYE